MKEEHTSMVFFLISAIVIIGTMIFLWSYLTAIFVYIGVFLSIIFVAVLVLVSAAAITHMMLIPFFAVRKHAEVKSGNYSVEDAKEPEKDGRS